MAVTSAEVDTAIRHILTAGQSYTLSDGRAVSHANLAELRRLRAELAAEEASEANGGVYHKLEFGRPS
jgi:hypothetical protein